MRNAVFCLIYLSFTSCHISFTDQGADQNKINATLDQWHKAAANADFDNYFKLMTENSVFIGTDATENWKKADFMVWAKPYFDKGKAWNFTSLDRHIYFAQGGKIAWFDELLNTQMKICRGSGVMVKEDNEWKIEHYVLSMTIPNEHVDTIVSIKAAVEDEMIKKLQAGSRTINH